MITSTPVIGYVLLLLAVPEHKLMFNIGTYPNRDQCVAARTEIVEQASPKMRKDVNYICAPMPTGITTTTQGH